MTTQKITRKKLIELYKYYDCNEWKNKIKYYLDSSSLEADSFLIHIKQEDINYAMSVCTEEQKSKIRKAGIKLENTDLLSQKWTMDKVWTKLGLDGDLILPYDEQHTLTKKQKVANAFVKIGYISDLFNEGWVPKFDGKQYNYYIWWKKNPSGSGWVFDGVCFHCYYGGLGLGFYFKDRETAEFIATTFCDIFNDYLSK